MPSRRVLFVLVLVMSALGSAIAGAGATRQETLSIRRLLGAERAVARWTPQRMREARPLPLLKVQPADLRRPPRSGQAFSLPAAASTEDNPTSTDTSSTVNAKITSSSTTTSSTTRRRPIPFQRFEIESPATDPYAAHGRIFGTSPTGDYSCSGTAITSDNRSVVWTAGHCLHLDGAASTNVVFVPGYEAGSPTPYGVWAADVVAIPAEWTTDQDARFDFGAFTVLPDENGMLLGDVIATRGIAFNQQPTEQLQSFGYPVLPVRKFDGGHLHSCTSQGSARIVAGIIAMGCDMEEGSSGGGWVMRDGFVMSNQSGGNMDVWPNMAFGPYLGTRAQEVYDAIRGGTAPMPAPTPTAASPERDSHTMSITLRMQHVRVAGRRRLWLTGRLRAIDGFVACDKTAPVTVVRRGADGRFYPVGKLLFSDGSGRYGKLLRHRQGVYATYAHASPYDLNNDCTDAVSPTRRDRH